jgi:hypothetical protein
MLTTHPSTERNLRAYPDGHLQPWEKKTVFFFFFLVMMMTMQLNRADWISILALAKPTSPPPPSTTLSSPCFACPVLPSCPAPVGISPGSGRQWAVVQVEASTTNRAASPPPAWFIHHHSPPRHMEADVPIAAATPRSASAPIPPLLLPLFLLSTVTSLLKICQRSVLSLQLLLVVLQ